MKICVLHLSDIHFNPESNWISNKTEEISRAIQDIIMNCQTLFFVFTGDVSFSGKKSEYQKATEFISKLTEKVKSINGELVTNYVIVPGNHDCDFDKDTATRERMINSVVLSKIEDVERDFKNDPDMMDIFTKVQDEFFTWLNTLTGDNLTGLNRLIWVKKFNIEGINIRFNCLNSSWLTRDPEKHSDLLFLNSFIQIPEDKADLAISVLHHPYNWIKDEKSASFRICLEKVSNIIVTGHEHSANFYEQIDFKGDNNQYLAGGVLQATENEISTFNAILINLSDRTLQYYNYSLKDGIYHPHSNEIKPRPIPLSKSLRQDRFIVNTKSLNFLQSPEIPYIHPRKKDLTLQDIYVFPDLEIRETGINKQGITVSGSEVLNFIFDKNFALIIGPDNSGKTSLLKMLFLELCSRGIVPIIIDGKEIVSPREEKLNQIISTKYIEQYSEDYLEEYTQKTKQEKAILIDNLNDLKLNAKGKTKLFENLSKNYGKIIITSNNFLELEEAIKDINSYFLNFTHCEIKEFGDYSIYKLIKKWYTLDREYSVNDIELGQQIKQVEDVIKTILGSVIPAYPFYLLTMIQSCDQTAVINIPLNKECGAFGYYYDWLVTYALSTSPKQTSTLNTKQNYLAELAFFMFQNKQTTISEGDLQKFHETYCQKYELSVIKDLPYKDLVDDFLAARILVQYNGIFNFPPKCVNYYFVSRAIDAKLQDHRTEEEMRSIIRDMALNINIESNAYMSLLQKGR